MFTTPFVESKTSGNITTITFFHPSHNSMPSTQLVALQTAIENAGMDAQAHVIILQSAGDKTFCAGASFDELAAIENVVAGKTFFMGFANVINAMRKCPKFIVVRVQGKAIGGGVGLAAAADYAIAHNSASIKLSELAVGIGPFVIGPVVERKIGLSAFSELAINATEWRTADWAKSRGLFHEVFDNVTQVDAYTTDLATRLSLFSLEAMQQLKKVLWQNTEHWDELLQTRALISGELILSDFSKKAIAKFKSKG